MISDESAQSSEDGSGLHSPVIGPAYPLPPGHNFRYQYDQTLLQRASTNHAPRYDYLLPTTTMNVQQLPHFSALQVPDPSAANHLNVGFSTSTFPIHSRAQPSVNPPQTSAVRQTPTSTQPYRQLDYRYIPPSEDVRRLPGDSVHEHSYSRHTTTAVPATSSGMQQNVIPPMPSAPEPSQSNNVPINNATTNSKPRKEISNVVIACNQCRSRKIRCDSKRPTCNNCARRSNACIYDAVPKRRGPDKHPGTRQRRPKKRILGESVSTSTTTKRRRTSADEHLDSQASMATNIKNDKDRPIDSHTHIPSNDSSSIAASSRQTADVGPSGRSESPPVARGSHSHATRSTAANPQPRLTHHSTSAPSVGSLEDKRTHWNAILGSYSLSSIVDAFKFLVAEAPQWFCFVNLEHLSTCLHDDDRRIHIQPAFIHSGMALATLIKSSEKGRGANGREGATRLAGLAQSAIVASYRAGWIDVKLAGAALIMSLFESSVHPSYNPSRLTRALQELDDIISTNKLTQRDASDPLATKFRAGSVPSIPETTSYGRAISKRCSCLLRGAESDRQASQSIRLSWNANWTAEEIEMEECRRVCWNALAIISNYNTLCVCHGTEPIQFWLADPGNYALLFPAEVIDRVSPSFAESPQSMSPKESVWALYCRSMLLFNFCTRLVWGNLGTEDKSEFASEALNETMSLQDSLDVHSCNFDPAIMHRSRELIQNSRFLVKKAHRSIIGYEDDPSKPFFSRGEADQWFGWAKRLIDQADSALSLRQHVEDKPRSTWTRRPFEVTWYSNQLALCLRMWNHDRSLVNFLELAKTVLRVVDVLNELWPCAYHQRHCEQLRRQLIDACNSVGLAAPLAPLPSLYHAPG